MTQIVQVLAPPPAPPPPPAQNPLSATWQYTPLPDNATIDTVKGPAAVTEIVRQVGLQKPNLNVWTFTAERYYATKDTPRVPVTCTSGDSHLNAAFAEGVPIPAGAKPTNDSDSTLLVYQEDSEHGGTYWEMWKAKQDPITGAWSCAFGGRMTNVNGVREGHYGGFTGGPPGTYEEASWGVQGSGLPYWPGLIAPDDIQRGYADHALLLEMINGAAGVHPWPAFRSDGGMTSGTWLNVWEGMRLRLPAGYPVSTSLHPICQVAIRTYSRHGAFITDKTAFNVVMRATPSCGPYLGSTADFDVLDGFPWHDLQVLTPGSDTTPVPVS